MRRNKTIQQSEFPLQQRWWPITQQMKDELQDLLKVSKYQSMSELVRDILDGKPIKATYYTAESDPLLDHLSANLLLFAKFNETIDIVFKRIYQKQASEIKEEDMREIVSVGLAAVEVLSFMYDIVEKMTLRFGCGEK